jgi:hypothetical protein
MGFDVDNAFFGNFHFNWEGTSPIWFSYWCWRHELPNPFIGWVNGDKFGDLCILGPDNEHTRLAKEWCRALEEKQPEIAKRGGELIATQERIDLSEYLYPHLGEAHALSQDEWSRRAVAAWYAILKHGVEHGETLTYC